MNDYTNCINVEESKFIVQVLLKLSHFEAILDHSHSKFTCP